MESKNKYSLLTIEDIAIKTNKSIKFVRREVAKGSLVSKKIRNKTYIKKEHYKNWLQNAKTSPCSYNKTKLNISENNDEINFIGVKEEMQKIDAWHNNSQIQDFNFIDLFAGAGGLSCGLVMSSMMPVAQVEIMPEAVLTYKYNFSRIKNYQENFTEKDIRSKKVKNDLINSLKDKKINLITGGFPCQGFSMAGNRIIQDPRNSLYLEMLDIVSKIKPDYILMENVVGLRSMLGGKVEEKIISDFKKIGYKINTTTLNSADYGVSQTRKRVIFIGNRIGAINYHPKPFLDEENYKTVKDAISKYLDKKEDKGINHIFTKSSSKMLKRIKELKEGESLYNNYSDAWKKVFWNKPSPTVKENHGGVHIHPIKNRVMTPRELASLQSFPDDFIFKGAKKWQLVQIGNAVPPLMAKAIGIAILKSYEEWKKKNDKK